MHNKRIYQVLITGVYSLGAYLLATKFCQPAATGIAVISALAFAINTILVLAKEDLSAELISLPLFFAAILGAILEYVNGFSLWLTVLTQIFWFFVPMLAFTFIDPAPTKPPEEPATEQTSTETPATEKVSPEESAAEETITEEPITENASSPRKRISHRHARMRRRQQAVHRLIQVRR